MQKFRPLSVLVHEHIILRSPSRFTV